MSDKKLKSALSAARSGLFVIPLRQDSRLPAIKKWPERATKDPNQITQWFTSSRNYNVGIACKDLIVIIDVDVKNGKPGLQSLQKLIALGLPKTLTVKTTTGGLHLYYKNPGYPVKTLADYLPGIDIRGNGGQGVAPGSTIGGKEYVCVNATHIQSIPKTIALPHRDEQHQHDSLTDSLITGGTSPYSELPEKIEAGGRDDVLFKYACSFRERGYVKEHALILMQTLHARCEQPPGDEIPLEAALAKVEQAWSTYQPAQWTQVITPTGTTVAAPEKQIKTLKEALDRFIFIIKDNRVADLLRPPFTSVMRLEEFKNAFKNVWIGQKSLPTVWMGNRSRQTVRDTVYYPDTNKIKTLHGEQLFNTYTPSLQEIPEKLDITKIRVFLDHVLYIMGNKENAERFILWCAMSVQMPEVRVPWMPLIITPPRCGKGMIFKALQAVVGLHNTAKVSPSELELLGKGFNEWLSGTLLVCFEEIKATRKWDITEKLKDITTEDMLLINNKHGKKGQERIFANLIAFSNHSDAAAISAEDGRFWVVHSRCARKDFEYYSNLSEWLLTDGPAHLQVFLSTLNISGFKWAEPPPMTIAKRIMIEESMSLLEQQFRDAVEDRDGPFKADIVDIMIVEEYLQSQLQQPLTTNEKYQIRHLIQDLTYPLKQERYRVQLGNSNFGAGRRYRCRSVRRPEHWVLADADTVAEEFNRAWMYLNGQTPPSTLKEVKTDGQ